MDFNLPGGRDHDILPKTQNRSIGQVIQLVFDHEQDGDMMLQTKMTNIEIMLNRWLLISNPSDPSEFIKSCQKRVTIFKID